VGAGVGRSAGKVQALSEAIERLAQGEPTVPSAPEPEEVWVPPAPTPSHWEVWMYLERHRKDTLRCLGSFESEWQARRFVAEAERKNPNPELRVHYEVNPVYPPDTSIDVEIYPE